MDLTAFGWDGLLFTRDLVLAGVTHRDIARAVRSAQLVRVRRGVYVLSADWDVVDERARHVSRMRAAASVAERQLTFARESAAALWGVPLGAFPKEVVVLEQWRGGGRSEPGVTRTARGAATADIVAVEGFVCTSIARTILDLTRNLPFARAVPLLDWVLSDRNESPTSKAELVAEAHRMKCSAAQWRAIVFADEMSGSIGESEARAAIHELGFVTPQLQRRFVDREGEIFPDFYWEGVDVAGEFDGKVKYTRDEFTKGNPSEAVWREKKREDRLRRQVRTVVRLLTSDVRRPQVLAALLTDAGVPRRRGGGGS